MKIIPFIYDDIDDLYANTYLLIDDHHNCVIIDPSSLNDGLINYISREQLTLKGILLTHAHLDHIRGVKKLYNQYHSPIYIHYLDKEALDDPLKNASVMFGQSFKLGLEVNELNDKDVLHLLDEDIEVLWTPYHTEGSCCYLLRQSKIIFTGDSLFKGSIGRDDFINSLPKYKKSSLERLMKLDDDIKIQPGHGKSSKIGEERITNYFVKSICLI